jgi:hypothetical protein
MVSASSMTVLAQAPHAPYAPFTARQAEFGKELASKSLEIRRQITDGSAPAEPFKIIGNLYFVGDANGEVFLLTSPKGHIMMGAGAANSTDSIQKNIESLGFKMTDVKAILLNHNHGDQWIRGDPLHGTWHVQPACHPCAAGHRWTGRARRRPTALSPGQSRSCAI